MKTQTTNEVAAHADRRPSGAGESVHLQAGLSGAMEDASFAAATLHCYQRLANLASQPMQLKRRAAVMAASPAAVSMRATQLKMNAFNQWAPQENGSRGPVQLVREGSLTNASFTSARTGLGDDADPNMRNNVVDFANEDVLASDSGKFLTPAHDASGWGFMVRLADAEAMRLALQNRNYPGIAWELRPAENQIDGGDARFQILRPVQDAGNADAGQPAMTPNDCYQKCLHTMQTQAPEAFFRNTNGDQIAVDANNPFHAKMALMEDAFDYVPAYHNLKAQYMAEQNVAARAQLAKQLDGMLLAPYAALSEVDRQTFDRDHEINSYAKPGEQEGFVTISDTSSATRDFAFHAGGILAGDGEDVVTWENFVNWGTDYGGLDADPNRTKFAVFKMYSKLADSGRTFHDQIALGGGTAEGLQEAVAEYGNTPITLPIRAAQALPPLQGGVAEPLTALEDGGGHLHEAGGDDLFSLEDGFNTAPTMNLFDPLDSDTALGGAANDLTDFWSPPLGPAGSTVASSSFSSPSYGGGTGGGLFDPIFDPNDPYSYGSHGAELYPDMFLEPEHGTNYSYGNSSYDTSSLFNSGDGGYPGTMFAPSYGANTMSSSSGPHHGPNNAFSDSDSIFGAVGDVDWSQFSGNDGLEIPLDFLANDDQPAPNALENDDDEPPAKRVKRAKDGP